MPFEQRFKKGLGFPMSELERRYSTAWYPAPPPWSGRLEWVPSPMKSGEVRDACLAYMFNLTPLQMRILHGWLANWSDSKIKAEVGLNKKKYDTNRSAVFRALKVDDQQSACIQALRHGVGL